MNRPRTARSRRVRKRDGAIMIVAMAALLLATMIGAAILKTALSQHHLTRRQQWRLQSAWLAESGLERAAAKLRDQPDYTGETWRISAKELGGRADAVVRLVVARDSGTSTRRVVTATATYPAGDTHRSRTTRTIKIDLNPKPPSNTKRGDR